MAQNYNGARGFIGSQKRISERQRKPGIDFVSIDDLTMASIEGTRPARAVCACCLRSCTRLSRCQRCKREKGGCSNSTEEAATRFDRVGASIEIDHLRLH